MRFVTPVTGLAMSYGDRRAFSQQGPRQARPELSQAPPSLPSATWAKGAPPASPVALSLIRLNPSQGVAPAGAA